MVQKRQLRRGEVYISSYSFPHERDATTKERPILILQNDEDNGDERYPLVLAAPITTQKTNRVYEQDVFLAAEEVGLRQDSKVLLGLVQPFLKERLVQKVGRLSPSKMREVDLKLLRLLGFIQRAEERQE